MIYKLVNGAMRSVLKKDDDLFMFSRQTYVVCSNDGCELLAKCTSYRYPNGVGYVPLMSCESHVVWIIRDPFVAR